MQSRNPNAGFTDPLHAAGSANDVVERAMRLAELDLLLRQSLPPALASRVRLANIRDGRLVFLANSPTFATRLRLHSAALLKAAGAAGLKADGITVKVATMQPVPPVEAPPTPLTPAARDALRAAASSTSDPELRSRLLDLASLA